MIYDKLSENWIKTASNVLNTRKYRSNVLRKCEIGGHLPVRGLTNPIAQFILTVKSLIEVQSVCQSESRV